MEILRVFPFPTNRYVLCDHINTEPSNSKLKLSRQKKSFLHSPDNIQCAVCADLYPVNFMEMVKMVKVLQLVLRMKLRHVLNEWRLEKLLGQIYKLEILLLTPMHLLYKTE